MSEYGLTTALGSSVNVPPAGSCEVGSAGTCHVVPLTALIPGTRYYHQLRTNGTVVQPVSSTTYFTTLKDALDASDFFFTIIGTTTTAPCAADADDRLRSGRQTRTTSGAIRFGGECEEATFPDPAPACAFTPSDSTLHCR